VTVDLGLGIPTLTGEIVLFICSVSLLQCLPQIKYVCGLRCYEEIWILHTNVEL